VLLQRWQKVLHLQGMLHNYSVAERLMRYVQIDTQSNPASATFPSTDKQKNLAKILVEELIALGVNDAIMNEHGYVMATVPSNSSKTNIPTICLCAHMDTAPDCSGTNIEPILHKAYTGEPIVLPHDASQVITTKQHPYLATKIGDDIITASGTTLLGADDKAGVSIIMDTVQYLMQNPSIKHGTLRVLFTPDEEVGRGVEQLDMKALNADYGYTLDGGERGSLEGESFSADAVTVTIHGISAHPGYAKNILVNAVKIASEFINNLPKDNWSPETTNGRQGFVHPISMEGIAEKTTINFIIRSFETSELAEFENKLKSILDATLQNYPGAKADFIVKEQYRNMREVLDKHPQVMQYAYQAMEQVGVQPEQHIIRGGTDGSRLSFMGLPCPNLFTGEMAIHSKHEYVSVQDMQKAVDTCVALLQIWEQNS
jgi:tripeptide aminopeptidase